MLSCQMIDYVQSWRIGLRGPKHGSSYASVHSVRALLGHKAKPRMALAKT